MAGAFTKGLQLLVKRNCDCGDDDEDSKNHRNDILQ